MSLFAKTLLWFLGTVLITMLAFLMVAAMSFHSGERRPPPLGLLLQVQLREARHAYETGGPEALRATLDRFRTATGADVTLTDAIGRELATGEDRSDLVEEARRRPRFPFLRHHHAILARRSMDGRYFFFVQIPPGQWSGWFLQPEIHVVPLGLLVVLCYAFARHLTTPVRELQQAVDRFGRGDLSGRVRSRRADELGQLASAFNQMADRIQTLLEAERRLLLDMSHELRSPLARLSLATELARTAEDKTPHLDRIEKEAERLNELLTELLQVTRAEGDVSQMNREPVRLDELVADVVETCRLEADARGCGIDVVNLDGITVRGDEELLRRAAENVLRNAIRFEPPGSRVEVSLGRKASSARLVVRDHGPGVPPESLPRLFEPFYRVDSDRNRATGGVGLGLAIARRAVELHKGKLEARNEPPGLVMEMELPM
ncbi:MAG: HAMP domain-containing protein [Acidobacteria bacterium]|nr:HAMP domain-containing protein [Acidobacteriota bacterium]